MTVPVIAVALDAFGSDVLASARGWLPPDRFPEVIEVGREPDLGLRLREALARMTRAGASARAGGPRVTIAAFVDHTGVAQAANLATLISALLHQELAAIFDPRATPDQRNAALHVLVRIPPLGATAAAASALRELTQLEKWAPAGGSYPILARIWPLSTQTTAGTMSERGLVTTAAVWLAALTARDEVDALAERFRHPRSVEARVSAFAAATLAIPEADVVEYARRRARYDALQRIAARASRPADRQRSEALISAYPLEEWTRSVDQGPEAGEIRALTAERSGAGAIEDTPIDVPPFASVAEIKEKNGALLEPATPPKMSAYRDDVRLSQSLERLTAKESEALTRDIEQTLDRSLGAQLPPEEGLMGLPETRGALQQIHARVWDRSAAEAFAGPLNQAAETIDPDPHRGAVDEAFAALLSPFRRARTALLAGFGVAMLSAAVVASVAPPAAAYPLPPAGAGRPVAQAAPPAPTSDAWNPRWPWIAGGLLGLITAVGYGFWAAGQAVRPIREVLELRRTALGALRQSGGGGRARAQLEREINVRARRLRRGIAHAIDLRLRRLNAIVSLVNEARDRAAKDLAALHIVVATSAANDDLSPLFPEVEPLHGHLVSPGSLARWVAEQRKVVDPDVWATRLVAETWDPGSLDGPCLDDARVARACDAQVEGVREKPPLSDPDLAVEAAQRASGFAQNVAHALGPPVRPRSETGDVIALREAARVVLVPSSEGDRVRSAFTRNGAEFQPQEMPSLGARAAMICFWEDLTVRHLAAGAGISA
ncbi:MAG: hypothetical protein U0270_02750 [Labilithrix sp.]